MPLVGNDPSVGIGVHIANSLGPGGPGVSENGYSGLSVSTNPDTTSFSFYSGCDEFPIYFTNANTLSVESVDIYRGMGWET